MTAARGYSNDILDGYDDKPALSSLPQRSNALSNKITSVLSASYADLEIREALRTLDEKGIENTAEARRRLILDVQKEVTECNGEIIEEFGLVAEVCSNRKPCDGFS